MRAVSLLDPGRAVQAARTATTAQTGTTALVGVGRQNSIQNTISGIRKIGSIR
jgi:hypothetical protein